MRTGVVSLPFVLLGFYVSDVPSTPQHVGLTHLLDDEDVCMLVLKTATEQKGDKDYAKRVQEHYDKMKGKKKPLKS